MKIKILFLYFWGNFLDAVQINYVKVPLAVKNNTNKPIILDCNYNLRPDDTDLVVKWYLNEEVVYQWIPPQNPQSLGLLKNRLDLKYRATDEPKSAYRAMKILNPTHDIAGEYKCFVSTFADEDFSVKNLIVFVPESCLHIEQEIRKTKENYVNFTCHADEVYPQPRLTMYKESHEDPNAKSRLQTIHWDINLSETGRYSAFIVASVSTDKLNVGDLIHCELRIPGTGYIKIKQHLYYFKARTRNNSEMKIYNKYLILFLYFINFFKYF